MKKDFTYGFYTDAREECFKKFGSIFDLPVVKNSDDVFSQLYKPGNSVLDIGAAKEKVLLKAHNIPVEDFYTLDNDPEGDFSYTTTEDIPKGKLFDIMTAFQFFEHLEIAESISLITAVSDNLTKGGYFLASVPNVAHPVRYWGDPTHRTFWDYKGLHMLLKQANISTEFIYRFGKFQPNNFIERYFTRLLAKIYRIDWCDSILIVGIKK